MTTGKLFRDPLTREQLNDIQQRRKGDADIRILLEEIRRLRHTYPPRLQQVLACIDENGRPPLTLRQILDEILDAEPVLREHQVKQEPEDPAD